MIPNKRRSKKRKKRVVAGIFLILVVITIIMAIVIVQNGLAESSFHIKEGLQNLEPKAEKLGLIEGLISKKSKDNNFSYSINTKIDFKSSGSEGEILLTNPIRNKYLMALEIVLEADERVVFRSGYLMPGQILKKASLQFVLERGEYRAFAHIWAIDPDSLLLLELFEEPIVITIEN
jgi:hypothetical protein